MPSVRSLIGALGLCVLSLLVPGRALACACCDAPGVVKVVGWSADGESLLFDRRVLAGCEDARTQFALRRGDQSAACFVDTKALPEYVCGSPKKGPRLSVKAADYPVGVRAIQAGHLRASVRVLSRMPYPTLRAVDVQVFAGGQWRALFTGRVFGWYVNEPEETRRAGVAERLEVVAALPTPSGEHAVLAIANFDGTPWAGSYATSLVWVDLPPAVGAAPGAPSEFESIPAHDPKKVPEYLDPIAPGPARIAVFEPGERTEHTQPVDAIRINEEGLTAHRKGDFAASSRLFAEALASDSDNPYPRYNLACAYARLEMPELAMAQLSIISTMRKCPKCAERLQRARPDQDFTVLHSRPDFRALVCGDAGDCLEPAAAVSHVETRATPPSASVPQAGPSATVPGPPRKGACDCGLASVVRAHRGTIHGGAAVVVTALARRRRRRALRSPESGDPISRSPRK